MAGQVNGFISPLIVISGPELTAIAETIATNPKIQPKWLAKHFDVNYIQDNKLSRPIQMKTIIESWVTEYEGDYEPRRALAMSINDNLSRKVSLEFNDKELANKLRQLVNDNF